MTENQTRKHTKRPEKRKSVSFDKREKTNAAPENETAGKILGFVSLKDFPELKSSTGNHDNVTHSQSSNRALQSNKSWLSVVSEGSVKNFKEAFPTLPKLESNRKNECNLISEKDDGKPQLFVRKENLVAEPTVETEDKKVQNPTNNKESKLKSSKKVVVPPQRNPHKKKRSDPVYLNFQDILLVYKPQKKPKKQTVFKNKRQQLKSKEVLSGNYLDSSNPLRSRGKHREIKKKKLTKLKLAIIKERILKQKMKERAVSIDGSECFYLVENLDLKAEIKGYLDELKKKKSIRNPLEGNPKTEKSDETAQEIKKEENSRKASNSKEKKIPQVSVGGEIKFSSKFREYCDNILTPALNTAVSELIRDLVKLQDRQFARDPVKAKAKKRHVSGLREVRKYTSLKKVKLMIIAPNLERVQTEGGVYDSINELKALARDQNVPYGFALDRYALGKCTKKNVPVSAFAVLNYEGLEASFENTLRHLEAAKESFLELTIPKAPKAEVDAAKEDVNARVMSSLISAFREGLQMSSEGAQLESE